MSDESAADKQFDPTPKKLQDARKKGEIARSADLNTAASYLGLLAVAYTLGPASLTYLAGEMAGLLRHAPDVADGYFSGQMRAEARNNMSSLALNGLVWFAAPAALVLLSLIAQQAIVVAPSRVEPKLSRIDPISNAKQKFGRTGLFEFFKSFVKLSVISIALGYFLTLRADIIVATSRLAVQQSVAILGQLFIEFLFVILLVSVVIGAVDFFWQRAEHIRKNRMTRKEMLDENKESEGDPHFKQARRQRAHDIAMNQMMQDVPGADVVIVNPTHYAVALKWSRLPGEAPVCVAKGVDEVARAIREVAQSAGVPLHSDPPTARAIHAVTEIGQEIRPDHYRAVAAAIRFAEAMRKSAKGRAWT